MHFYYKLTQKVPFNLSHNSLFITNLGIFGIYIDASLVKTESSQEP